jgi:hypothetical protein
VNELSYEMAKERAGKHDACGIISPVFESLEPIDQDRQSISLADVSDNSTHSASSSEDPFEIDLMFLSW